MATPNILVASTVMNSAAALLNDAGIANGGVPTVYTYPAQVPYLQIALNELQEKFQLNGLSPTQSTSQLIDYPAGSTTISFGATSSPALPNDLIEPQQLWECNTGIFPYIPMTKVEYLPRYMEGIETDRVTWWTWSQNQIVTLPSDLENSIKIDYIGTLFAPIVDENSQIYMINGQTWLAFRTAALMAEFIERNITSSQSLNAQCLLAIDRVLGISVKGKQSIQSRRRPFRSAYKRLMGGWR
jgi:hypothetical protein